MVIPPVRTLLHVSESELGISMSMHEYMDLNKEHCNVPVGLLYMHVQSCMHAHTIYTCIYVACNETIEARTEPKTNQHPTQTQCYVTLV